MQLYDQLKSLIAAKIQAIEANTRLLEYSLQRIRPHIRKMVDIYRKGQLEILQDALLEAERQFDQTYESYAAAYGEEDDEGQN